MNAIVRKPMDLPVTVTAERVTAGAPEFVAFVTDEQTAGLLGRLTREGMTAPTVHQGGVRAAVATPGVIEHAQLLVLDLTDSEDPLADLDALADRCDPNVIVITFGTINDVSFYRQLTEAGVADYLLKPVNEAALRQALGTATTVLAAKAKAAADASTIAVVGARGGVGASMVALNIGSAIAKQGNERTLVLDLDLHFGTAALSLDLEPSRGLREALEDPSRVDAMFLNSTAVQVRDDLYLMAAEDDLGTPSPVTGATVGTLIETLKESFGSIVVEVPRHDLAQHSDILEAVDRLLIVTDATLHGLRDASRIVGMARGTLSSDDILILVNRMGQNPREELSRKDIERTLDTKLAAILPDLPKVFGNATRQAKTLHALVPGSKLVKQIDAVALRLSTPADDGLDPLLANKTKGSSKRKRS